MKLLHTVYLIAGMTLSFTVQSQSVSIDDLSPLFGQKMSGELIYLDYQSGKEVSIPVELTIEKSSASSAKYSFRYPGEASANNEQKVKISKDGTSFNNEKVIDRKELKDGVIQITTISDGKDDGKKASFVTTYMISSKGYSSEKLVKYNDGTELLRNRYVLIVVEK